MQDYIDLYCQDYLQDNQIKVINIADLSAAEVRGKILILDEIDHMVKAHMVYFKTRSDGKDTITGLVMAKLAKQIIMMSATTNKFDIRYFNKIHGITEEHI